MISQIILEVSYTKGDGETAGTIVLQLLDQLYHTQKPKKSEVYKTKGVYLGILRIETALTGVSVSARTVRRLFT